mgnify:CR=1 FL=1
MGEIISKNECKKIKSEIEKSKYCIIKGKVEGLVVDLEEMKENRKEGIPVCPHCGKILKPEVVLYGEALDNAVVEESIRCIAQADTLIVGGTSLVVYPAAGLLQYFKGKHLILINKDMTSMDHKADIIIHDPIGEVLKEVVLD